MKSTPHLAYDQLTFEQLAECSDEVLKKMPKTALASVERLIKMGSVSSSFMDALEKELGLEEGKIRPRREELVEIVTQLLIMRRASIVESPRVAGDLNA